MSCTRGSWSSWRGIRLLSRGAVVMRSDLAASLDVDAQTVELLIAHAVTAGHVAAATWLTAPDGEDAALVALLAPTDARLVTG